MIILENITKIYNHKKDNEYKALSNINITINSGELIAIMGDSGAGKSTLLHLIACIDKPTSGNIIINGNDCSNLSEKENAKFRNSNIGLILQDFFLIDEAKVIENVLIPLSFTKIKEKEKINQAAIILNRLGLGKMHGKYVFQLSGGEKQRVAIARALINNPSIILADEPTGSLDSNNTEQIMKILTKLNNENITVIIITHDIKIADRCKRKIVLNDGAIIEDTSITTNLEQENDHVE